MTRPVIGFAGMTHLGINSAAGTMQRGFDVICFDPDAAAIARLRQGDTLVSEPGLDDIMRQRASQVRFSDQPADLVQCDLVYISTDVPTDDNGVSDLTRVRALIESVKPALAPNAILVVLCQVPPGFTRALDFPQERLYYQVETLIFGRAVDRAVNPERFIVGCAQPGAALPAAFQTLLEAFACPILKMRYESAELAKISINMFLISTVTTANALAEVCEQIGADWNEIMPAMRLDKRIGPHAYLAPGLGIAGGNLERDIATLCAFADRHGTDAATMRAWSRNSRYRRDWVLRLLHRVVLRDNPAPVIAVLGLAYKQDTASVKNSPSLALLKNLHHLQVRLFDPVVPASAAAHPAAFAAESALQACEGADLVIIMTPWPEFAKIDPAQLKSLLKTPVLIDPYRVLPGAAAAGLRYHTLGTSTATGPYAHA